VRPLGIHTYIHVLHAALSFKNKRDAHGRKSLYVVLPPTFESIDCLGTRTALAHGLLAYLASHLHTFWAGEDKRLAEKGTTSSPNGREMILQVRWR
jgi:hypothetical protein